MSEEGRNPLIEWTRAMIFAVLIALGIRTTIAQAYEIPSGSMEPTLLVGDHLMADKIAYGLRFPDSLLGVRPLSLPYGHYLIRLGVVSRGDVIIFVSPPQPSIDLIKRVIGVAGDKVQIKNGRLWLNDTQVADPHAHFSVPDSARSPESPRDNFGPVIVPPKMLFVMGDNRDNSWDSRFWGFVPIDSVEARAMFIYWPWDSSGDQALPLRWSRFGMAVR
jgi:signal peptidase I